MKAYHTILLVFLIGCLDESDRMDKSYWNPIVSEPQNSILQIQLFNSQADTIEIDVVPFKIFAFGNRSDKLFIKDEESHSLSILTNHPAKIRLLIEGKSYFVIQLPDDTTRINYDLRKDSIWFNSRNEEINVINEYYRKKEYTDEDFSIAYNEFSKQAANYSSLSRFLDSLYIVYNDFLIDDFRQNDLPLWFENFERAEIQYRILGTKTSFPHINEIFNYFSDSLPANYFAYLDSVKIDNPDAILSGWYYYFLDTYFWVDIPVDSFHHHRGLKRRQILLGHLLKRAKKELKGNVRKIYFQQKFSETVTFYSDTSNLDSLAQQFEIKDHSKFTSFIGTKQTVETGLTELSPGDTLPTLIFVDEADSLAEFAEASKGLTYVNIWATWCGPCIANFPQLNQMISTYSESEVRFINICISSRKDHWKNLVNKHKLRGTNLFAEGNWSQKVNDVFGINGIPHYLIVNRNILVLNDAWKAPEATKTLDSLITSNL